MARSDDLGWQPTREEMTEAGMTGLVVASLVLAVMRSSTMDYGRPDT